MGVVASPSVDRFLPIITQALDAVRDQDSPRMDRLSPDHTLAGDLGLSSLEVMKLALELEKMLKITIEESAEFEIETVGELCAQLDNWVSHGGSWS